MVLRDIYINSTLRSACFFLLLLIGSCQQSPADNNTSEQAAQAAEKEKAAKGSVVEAMAITLRAELEPAMQDMNNIVKSAEALHLNATDEKGKALVSKENVDVVFEKSASVLGAMFILKGSLDAIQQRYDQGILDQKQAVDMLNKLDIDLKSYQSDIKDYKDLLRQTAPAAPMEKK